MSALLLSFVFNSEQKVTINQDWITGLFVIILLLLVWEFVLYRKKIGLVIPSFFSQRYYSQLTREGRILDERFYILDIVIIFLIQSLSLYMAIDYFFPSLLTLWNPIFIILTSLLAVIINYIFKIFSAYVFFYIFDFQEQLSTYNQYKLFYLTLNSSLLLLVSLFYFYTSFKIILFFYIPFFLVIFSVLAYRLFSLSRGKSNPFHFFVYFCTFEILPCFLVVKFLFILENRVL